jgi:hypothetical protein
MVNDVNMEVEKLYLNCCFLDARGMLDKLDELKMRAIEDDLDIIGIAESWLTDSIEQAEVAIDVYKTYRKDRLEVKAGKGGGVVLYVKRKSQHVNVWF